MTTPIDYSRPVGWWCPVCGATGGYVCHGIAPIPRYLPIPEGQRPPAASEVGDAEVVTYIVGRDLHAYGPPDPRLPWICRGSGSPPTFLDINTIVTGATE